MKQDIITRGLQLAKELNDNPTLAKEVGLTIKAETVAHILDKVERPLQHPRSYGQPCSESDFQNTKTDMVNKLNGKK